MNNEKEYKVLNDYRIWLRFDDNVESTIDIKPLLIKGITLELLDPTAFRKVAIESDGRLALKNGFDICPNSFRELVELKVHAA